MHGELDKLMTWPVTRRLAETYRSAFSTLVSQHRLDAERTSVRSLPGAGGQDDVGEGVRFCVVPGAGHRAERRTVGGRRREATLASTDNYEPAAFASDSRLAPVSFGSSPPPSCQLGIPQHVVQFFFRAQSHYPELVKLTPFQGYNYTALLHSSLLRTAHPEIAQ